jgi:hypothetical protein
LRREAVELERQQEGEEQMLQGKEEEESRLRAELAREEARE